jgi:hypothetical protein
MKKNIAIFGQNGQVANALIKKFSENSKFNVVVFSHHECNFADLSNLRDFFNNCQQLQLRHLCLASGAHGTRGLYDRRRHAGQWLSQRPDDQDHRW